MVTVYRLVAKNTLEGRNVTLYRCKRELARCHRGSTPRECAASGTRLGREMAARSDPVSAIHADDVRVGRPLGSVQSATARILPPDEGKRADRLITRKYGWLKRVFTLIAALRRSQPAYLEIR